MNYRPPMKKSRSSPQKHLGCTARHSLETISLAPSICMVPLLHIGGHAERMANPKEYHKIEMTGSNLKCQIYTGFFRKSQIVH